LYCKPELNRVVKAVRCAKKRYRASKSPSLEMISAKNLSKNPKIAQNWPVPHPRGETTERCLSKALMRGGDPVTLKDCPFQESRGVRESAITQRKCVLMRIVTMSNNINLGGRKT